MTKYELSLGAAAHKTTAALHGLAARVPRQAALTARHTEDTD